jgi:hypothetical protein
MPMLQFSNWWGLNPWFVAGIDYEGKTTPGLATSVDAKDTCICMNQYQWQSDGHWSRDDLIAMIIEAEEFFIHEARYYPAPSFIPEERNKLNYNGVLGYSFLNNSNKYKSIKPKFSCELQGFGYYSLTLNSTETLVKDIVGVIQDEFTTTATVPSGTTADEIRVFFTSADGGYTGDPEFNDHTYEIRPLTITVSGTTATIVGPAYLFKKPSLDEETDCVYHELTTYVDEVSVYITTIDNCSHGSYICSNDNCNTTPCSPTVSNICMSKKYVGGQFWGVPFPAECNAQSELVKYCLTCLPDEIEYNYLTGASLLTGGYMDNIYVEVLSKLAIGLADCLKEWCQCDVCSNKKTEYYRQTPNALFKRETDRQENDWTWQIILSNSSVEKLNGLPPYNGILQALRFIGKNSCKSVEGALL